MQLTKLDKPKPFDVKSVKQILIRTNKYITDLMTQMPVPVSAIQRNEDPDEQEIQYTPQTNGTDKVLPMNGPTTARASTLMELHQKLQQLKGKRLDYKEKLLKKGLKNRLKKKTKKEERSMQKKLAKTELAASGASKVKQENGETVKFTKPKPVFNSDGKMVFSKFDFSEIGSKKAQPKEPKTPKKILERLDKQNTKINQLEQEGKVDAAEELKQKQVWRTALAKASGEKVKDNPELLKKSIKRVEQKKKKSAKKWESRIEGVKTTVNAQQTKRQDNILKRKKDKKVNKLKKASKRGRIIPGF